jgi:nucleoside-diphosphate-sugar epimerase
VRVRIALTGGTGVIGRRAIPALIQAGHEVVVMVRSDAKARVVHDLGASAVVGDLFSGDDLRMLFEGADVAINLATHIPVGLAAAVPGAWRANDLIRTKGVAGICAAARQSGVSRLIQESVSYLYADAGTEWINEDSALDITAVTEPMAMAESQVASYVSPTHSAVALRLGLIVGDDPMSRFNLKTVRSRRPIGLGDPQGWAHVIHTDDVGTAVAAAVTAPSGVYNVGAAPVRRADLVDGYAVVAGVKPTGFVGPVVRRIGGARLEPLSRSLRVCNERFTAATGWAPSRPRFSPDWLALTSEPKTVTQ